MKSKNHYKHLQGNKTMEDYTENKEVKPNEDTDRNSDN